MNKKDTWIKAIMERGKQIHPYLRFRLADRKLVGCNYEPHLTMQMSSCARERERIRKSNNESETPETEKPSFGQRMIICNS